MNYDSSNGIDTYRYEPRNPFPTVRVVAMRLGKARKGFYYELACDDEAILAEAIDYLRMLGRDWTYWNEKEGAWYVSGFMLLTLAYFLPDLAGAALALVRWLRYNEPRCTLQLQPYMQSRYTPPLWQLSANPIATIFHRDIAVETF